MEGSRDFSVSAILERVRSSRESEPKYSRPALSSEYVAPSTTTEQRIAAVWEELLGIEQVGVHDDFFELGGNSLIGVGVIARLRAEFNSDTIPANVFCEAPTVHVLARCLGGIARQAGPPPRD